MDTKTLGIICLNSIADIYIHFYKNEYKYYNVNIKSFNLSKTNQFTTQYYTCYNKYIIK